MTKFGITTVRMLASTVVKLSWWIKTSLCLTLHSCNLIIWKAFQLCLTGPLETRLVKLLAGLIILLASRRTLVALTSSTGMAIVVAVKMDFKAILTCLSLLVVKVSVLSFLFNFLLSERLIIIIIF